MFLQTNKSETGKQPKAVTQNYKTLRQAVLGTAQRNVDENVKSSLPPAAPANTGVLAGAEYGGTVGGRTSGGNAGMCSCLGGRSHSTQPGGIAHRTSQQAVPAHVSESPHAHAYGACMHGGSKAEGHWVKSQQMSGPPDAMEQSQCQVGKKTA